MDKSPPEKSRLYGLSFAALGVVFGDLGTSPLYAFNQAVSNLAITPDNIYGVLSLIFWALAILVCFKYLVIVFNADNDGEGGVIALAGVIRQKIKVPGIWLLFVTIIGIGLIIGDGILTPAISILSAVEGLKSLSGDLDKYILHITIVILFLLFWMQYLGTGKIGVLFAPVLLLWFITIGILGFRQIMLNPNVLTAINPYYAFHFFATQKHIAILAMGGIFLVMTGGEALFADLGHFGKNPIRLAWFCVVLPGLILCYFGQGAQLLAHPETANNPFYSLSPHWFLPYMIIIATAATIIASQSIISATFSIIKQTSLLNLVPRLKIKYTSASEKGQVYLPFVNFILLIGTCTLVLSFKTSDNLASAFGIAVNLDMIITTLLVAYIAYACWKWNVVKLAVFPFFLCIELTFLAGNLPKFMDGGWVPILVSLLGFILMYTWYRGVEKLRELNHRDSLFDTFIIDEFNQNKVSRQPGLALFITDPYDFDAGSLLHHLRINRLLPENIIFLSVKIQNKPIIPVENKFELVKKAQGLYMLYFYYGFTENINLPDTIDTMLKTIDLPFELDRKKMVYYIETISAEITTEKVKQMMYWQKILFSIMLKNQVPDIQFYRLPHEKTIAIGTYYQL